MLTDQDRKDAEEWVNKELGDLRASRKNADRLMWTMTYQGVLYGIEHERKRWRKYHPEPGYNYALLTPKNPFNIIEQVGEKHWRIKDSSILLEPLDEAEYLDKVGNG